MTPTTNISKQISLSPQQTDAVKFVKNPVAGNMMLTAVAGSGKTFTLLEILKALPEGRVAFCAFSKNIQLEIAAKVETIRPTLHCTPFVGTTHSFGFGAIRKVTPYVKVDDRKIETLMEDSGVPVNLRAFVRKAYRLSRQWGIGVLPEFKFDSGDAWEKLIDHFDLEGEIVVDEDNPNVDFDELLVKGVKFTIDCLKLGVNRSEKMIDFEDMIWLPLYKNLKMWTYDTILVDECQDINPTRRALVRKMLNPGGRAFFVGDPRQAIFGFTGADSESCINITNEFGCTELPLTFSFRCPKAVVTFAKQWVSHIESTPDAPEGIMKAIDVTSFWGSSFVVEDAILCRNNAPLVDVFFELLSRGIPSHIEGKDIAAELIKTVNRFPKAKTIPTLIEKLEDYKGKQIQKWSAKGKEEKAARVADVVNAIVAIATHIPADASVNTLKDKISSMFLDTNGEKAMTLTLTTIHKAKGREWNRVFWYGRNRWNPSPYARKEWQKIAEDNLCYVAATRAKRELYDVYVPPKSRRMFQVS
jgi:superfamily I DNA/RNA helicase